MGTDTFRDPFAAVRAGACEKVPGERGSMPMVPANDTAVVVE